MVGSKAGTVKRVVRRRVGGIKGCWGSSGSSVNGW